MALLAARRSSRMPNANATSALVGRQRQDPHTPPESSAEIDQRSRKRSRHVRDGRVLSQHATEQRAAGTHCPILYGRGTSLRVLRPDCINAKRTTNAIRSCILLNLTRAHRVARPRPHHLRPSTISHITRPRNNQVPVTRLEYECFAQAIITVTVTRADQLHTQRTRSVRIAMHQCSDSSSNLDFESSQLRHRAAPRGESARGETKQREK